jgi:hypothetical protein
MTTDDEVFDWPAVQDEMHLARGRFLDLVATMEDILDLLLLLFFEVPPFRKQHIARGSLLARLSLSAKVDTLGHIISATGLPFDAALRELREAVTFRNLVAHASVSLKVTRTDADTVFEPSAFDSATGKARRQTPTPVSVDSIEEWSTRVLGLLHQLADVERAITALPRGDEAVT